MAQAKIKYQQFTFNVTTLGQEFPIDVDTDKLYNTITGINILQSDDLAKFSTLNLNVNNTEVFPENFEAVRLRFRDQGPMGFDYHPLNEPAGGSKIKGKYTDKAGATYPYSVTFSLRLENTTSPDKSSTGKAD